MLLLQWSPNRLNTNKYGYDKCTQNYGVLRWGNVKVIEHHLCLMSLVAADEDCPALDVTAFCNCKVHVHKDCMWCYYFMYILLNSLDKYTMIDSSRYSTSISKCTRRQLNEIKTCMKIRLQHSDNYMPCIFFCVEQLSTAIIFLILLIPHPEGWNLLNMVHGNLTSLIHCISTTCWELTEQPLIFKNRILKKFSIG